MKSARAFVVGSASFLLGIAFLACSSDDKRPPAAGSGSVNTSSGVGASSGSSGGDGSAPDGGASSSSGGSSGGSSGSSGGIIQTGLRASVGSGAVVEFNQTIGATRNGQTLGMIIEINGTDVNGNALHLTLTSTQGIASAGSYNCSGASGTKYGKITYTAVGGAAGTWTSEAAGECSIMLRAIDNQANGIMEGTFSGTAKGDAGPDKNITFGEFRLQLD